MDTDRYAFWYWSIVGLLFILEYCDSIILSNFFDSNVILFDSEHIYIGRNKQVRAHLLWPEAKEYDAMG